MSARKYRPSTFNTVVGQQSIAATLKNSIATDRLAHAYLFCGSRGVGKTSCARIFAKTINCEHRTPDGNACNECESCRAFNEGRSLNIIELDAASNNSVDDIRNLTEQVLVPPTNGKYRVFIVDEVHMLSQAAFNAFLKTLEEPPSYVIFILATTEKHKIIPTILSRCQIYDFNRITIQDMVDHLAYVASREGMTAEPAALNIIARKADGAMRDALSIFDQVAASSLGKITYKSTIDNLNILDYEYYSRLTDAFLSGNVAQALLIYKEIRDEGFDSQFFINGLAAHFRDLMVARDPATLCLLEASAEAAQIMAAQAQNCPADFIYKALSLCNDADLNYKIASNKQLLVELTLIKLCQLNGRPAKEDKEPEQQLKKLSPAPQPTARQVVRPPADASQIQPPTKAAVPPTKAAGTKAPKLSLLQKGPDITLAVGKDDNKVKREPRKSPYTEKDFLEAWDSYISAHPSDLILINAMNNSRPKRIDEDKYEITVENPAQHDLVAGKIQDLLSYLHDKLSNDSISLDVAISQQEPSPYTWKDREVLDYMIEENPYMKKFMDDFRLTLS